MLELLIAASVLFAAGADAQGAGLNPSPDKSGIGPKSVSLPAGPGSIRGFGASYAWRVPGNKGASRYEIEVRMPEGPSGQVPKISIVYGSDLGMDALGLGWRLSLPHVERDTVERLPVYDEPYLHDVFPASLEAFRSEAGDKLVEVDSGFFFAEHESRFVRYRRLGEGWEASMPDGSRLYLGLQRQAKLMDRFGARVFRWLPERIVDPHGNETRYFYREAGNQEGTFVSAKYLSRIEYGPGPGPWRAFYMVHFDYEERPDKVLDGTPGFLVENHLRLVAIEVLAQGAPRSEQAVVMDRNGDGIDEQLIRRYRFGYKPKDRFTALSLVESVTETGRDGKLSLPPVTFEYSAPGEAADGPVSLRSSTFVGDATDLGPVSDSSVELVDLNSDALPDLLMTPGRHGWPHRALLNLGVNDEPGSAPALRLSGVRELSGGADAESVTLAAGAQDAALSDFNGDGRVDLGYQSVVHELHYFPGTGEVGWGERRRFESDSSVPQRFPGSGSPTFQVDLDGDRRIDLAQTSADGLDLTVWFCLETGYSDPVTWNCPEHCDFRDGTTRLADMTGDGQPDLVWIGEGGVRAAPGVGFGRFDPSVREFPFPSGGFISYQELTESRLVDVTGDGLSDLVIGQGTDELRVAVNQGGVALSDWIVFVDVPPRSILDAKVRWADMNGNGSADYVVLDDSDGRSTIGFADLLMALDVSPKPNLLTRVDNGLGSVTAIEYVNATEQMAADGIAGHAWDTTHPFPVAVVESVSDHTYPHREPSTIRYRYRNGIYALAVHENRGFAQVREIEEGQVDQHPTLVIETHFNRGDRFAALKAKPWRRRLLDADDRVWEETTTVWSDPPRPLHASGGVPVVHFAHPVESTRRISGLGLAPDALLKERFEYNDWGNLVRHEEHGRVDPAGVGPPATNRRTRLVDYVLDRERWMLRARARERLLDEAGNLVTRTDYHYDDEGFDAGRHGTITRGNLTMVRRWRGPAPKESGSASVSPPADEFVIETRNRHDAFGNILVDLGPLATLGPNGNPVDASGHIVRYAYDSRFRSRPVRETFVESDSKQLVHSFEYDEGIGALTLHRGPNGAVSRYRYDALGRLTEIVRPGDSSEFPSMRYRYVPGHVHEDSGRVSWIETQLLDAPPESGEDGSARDFAADEHYFRSWRFLDGRGRALYTKHEGGESADGDEGPVMVGVASFTRRGKLASSLAPCLSTLETVGDRDPFAWENPFEPAWRCDSYYEGRWHRLGHASTPQTRRRYDVLGREIESENPDGTRRRIRYGPLLRTHEDENVVAGLNGAPIRYHDDGLGRLVAITEHPRLRPPASSSQEREEWRTTFQYDAADRMTGFINAKGEQRIVVYDGLGRVDRISDPAFGVHEFAHDAASNVVGAIDSEGRTARYAYDGLNRLVSEVHSQLGRDDTIRVAYDYDTTANGVGRLGFVTDEAGSLRLDYDIRSRVTSKTRRFAPAFGGGTFSMSQTYDALDRITSSTYPDGDRATMHYNARNLPHSIRLDSIGDVVASVVYRPDEQPREVVFGNETVRRHTYDRRSRQIRTELLDARSETLLFREELSFDPTSNVVMRDRRTIGQSHGLDRSLREHFEHDDVHRLKSVSYEPPLASGVSRRTYGFDPIGDMLSASLELSEDKSGSPLAVVERYSPILRETTGRAIHLDGYSLAWDPQGCLMRATGPTNRILIAAQRFAPNGTGKEWTYQYDRIGNLIAATVDGAPVGTAVDRDDSGRVVRTDDLAIRWNAEGRLGSLYGRGIKLSNVYGYQGRRVVRRLARTADPEAEERMLSPFRDYEHYGKRVIKFIKLFGGMVATVETSSSAKSGSPVEHYHHTDHLGSSIIRFDDTGTIVGVTELAPYGALESSQGVGSFGRGFTGAQQEGAFGLTAFEARYLHEATGRFLSPDPALVHITKPPEFPQTLNPFAYANNRPLTYIDPDGRVAYMTTASDPTGGASHSDQGGSWYSGFVKRTQRKAFATFTGLASAVGGKKLAVGGQKLLEKMPALSTKGVLSSLKNVRPSLRMTDALKIGGRYLGPGVAYGTSMVQIFSDKTTSGSEKLRQIGAATAGLGAASSVLAVVAGSTIAGVTISGAAVPFVVAGVGFGVAVAADEVGRPAGEFLGDKTFEFVNWVKTARGVPAAAQD